ncbi:hypothetical protein [Cyanobium sp. Morenito 9A2]|uniref:hypothetical protein n=1 Tax=Cyanobium sp. Morenito 9A2 TaxID=2823718 RepID=UPI0020CCE088|nr:hypothetical protein [Cyanobium sp. Morenito 9A2]MCP9848271.1 hypothetical protein [Cyanobium sp. Morenito 9A2]
MTVPSLTRRQLLSLSALGAVGLLGGCGDGQAPQLLSSRGQFPAAWLKRLPSPWQSRRLESAAAVLQAAQQPRSALVQLGDGWAQTLGPAALQAFEPGAALEGLLPQSEAVSRLFRDGSRVALPWAFGTWLLLLRSRPDLAAQPARGWGLLLDPSLKQKLVLPSSPRLVIELALRQLGSSSADPAALADPRLPAQLARLRCQALAFDERDGLNLLLSGRAQAAVLPSQVVLPLLRRDLRLSALLPSSGSPLWWNLLLVPAGEHPAPALDWLRECRSRPMLDRLLSGGWVPPLRRERLGASLALWPKEQALLLYPEPAVLERCNSLPPLNGSERQRYQRLWDQAAA